MAGDAIGMYKALGPIEHRRSPREPHEFRQGVLFSNSASTHERRTICSTTLGSLACLWARVQDSRPMTSDEPTPPQDLPLAAVQRALRETTEFIAHELAQPHAVGARVVRVRMAHRACGRHDARRQRPHGGAHALAGTCRAGDGFWPSSASDRAASAAHRGLCCKQVDARARTRGVPLVALKGAALHAHGIYAPGERPMADLDLLVSEADAARAAELLTELGFHPGHLTWKHQAFEPDDGAMDPARSVRTATIPSTSSCTAASERSCRCARWTSPRSCGRAHHGPGSTTTLRAARCCCTSCCTPPARCLGRTTRLLHLHDIARLTSTMGPADWDELFRQAQASADPELWWAYPPLLLTRSLLPLRAARGARACGARLSLAAAPCLPRPHALGRVVVVPVGERLSGDRVVALARRDGGLCCSCACGRRPRRSRCVRHLPSRSHLSAAAPGRTPRRHGASCDGCWHANRDRRVCTPCAYRSRARCRRCPGRVAPPSYVSRTSPQPNCTASMDTEPPSIPSTG